MPPRKSYSLLATRYSLLLLLLPATAIAATLTIKTNAPIKNFQLPLFDKTDRLSATVKAEQAHIPDDTHIRIVNMTLTQYEYPKLAPPGAQPTLTTTLTAPDATVYPRDQRVAGNATIHLHRPDLDVTGADWTYDHRTQKLTLARDTRVTLLAPLPAALTQPLTPTLKKTNDPKSPDTPTNKN